jgi:hypothetical protein
MSTHRDKLRWWESGLWLCLGVLLACYAFEHIIAPIAGWKLK